MFGYVATFLQLAAARVGLGISEAAAVPASASMLSDLFPRDRRTAPLALLAVAAPVGTMMAFTIGGIVNAAIGWRMTYVIGTDRPGGRVPVAKALIAGQMALAILLLLVAALFARSLQALTHVDVGYDRNHLTERPLLEKHRGAPIGQPDCRGPCGPSRVA